MNRGGASAALREQVQYNRAFDALSSLKIFSEDALAARFERGGTISAS
jgi:hypothetical protein